MSRIHFFRVNQSEKLSRSLQTHLQIELQQAEFLIHFGAIYCNFKRTTEDIIVNTGDILRCHIEPKRYLTDINWKNHLVFENENFLVIDKPAGIPCQAGLDNRIENLVYQASDYTKLSLFITHRLDIGTKGLVVLAKTKAFQTEFNQILERRQATKIYEALTLGPTLPLGALCHWMRPQARSPKVLSRTLVDQWKICELDIIDRRRIAQDPMDAANPEHGLNYYKIQLHTGRTHQIRAQLSFEQNPLLGDTTYGGPSHQRPFDWHALQCCELAFTHENTDFHWRLPSLSQAINEANHKDYLFSK